MRQNQLEGSSHLLQEIRHFTCKAIKDEKYPMTGTDRPRVDQKNDGFLPSREKDEIFMNIVKSWGEGK